MEDREPRVYTIRTRLSDHAVSLHAALAKGSAASRAYAARLARGRLRGGPGPV